MSSLFKLRIGQLLKSDWIMGIIIIVTHERHMLSQIWVFQYLVTASLYHMESTKDGLFPLFLMKIA